MIPKRAIFYWSDWGHLPPLRRCCIDSFRLLNPTWEVVELASAFKQETALQIVHESDKCRYIELHKRGGFYFDTDIMFARPIPDSWLLEDLVLPLGENGKLDHIAAMGARPLHPLFLAAIDLCGRLESSGRYVNYQGYGTDLLRNALDVMGNVRAKWIEHERFIPVPYTDVARLWNPWVGAFPELTIGVHWFGGDPLSREIESEGRYSDKSLVAMAQRMSMRGVQHAEMHGA